MPRKQRIVSRSKLATKSFPQIPPFFILRLDFRVNLFSYHCQKYFVNTLFNFLSHMECPHD